MTALWILCAVLVFITLILFIPIGIELRYDTEIKLSLVILFFRYRLIPKKKKKINLRKFSKKRYEKMIAKEKKKEAKKAAKKAAKEAKKKAEQAEAAKKEEAAKEKKKGVPQIVTDLWEMRSMILRTVRRFIGRIKTQKVKIRLLIGSDNAASSALIYGAAANAAVDIEEILRTQTDLRRECEIALGVDFTSEKTVADVEVRFAVTLANVLATAISFVFGFVKHKIKQN